MLRLALIALALTGISACATQQRQPPPPVAPQGPTSPASPAGYKVSIDNPDVWRDVGTGAEHLQTGIVCPGAVGDFRLTSLRAYPNVYEGDDVSCGFSGPNAEAITFYLTRARSFAQPTTEQGHFTSSIGHIKDAIQVTGEIDLPLPSDAIPPTSLSAGFTTTITLEAAPGQPVDTALWLNQIGRWHVKTRATYPRMSARAVVELVSGLYSMSRLTLPGGTT